MTDGLRIESAASVMARDSIVQHFRTFARVIRDDRAANASVVAAYVDGLAGAAALTIIGKHGSEHDVTEAVVKSLREALRRDLAFLGLPR